MTKIFFGKLGMLIFLFSLLTACNTSAKKTFERFSDLQGSWKAKGNIVLYDRWKQPTDSLLVGQRFSVNGTDTLFLNDFRLEKNNNIVLFGMRSSHTQQPFTFYQRTKTRFGKTYFENKKAAYPNRVIIGLPHDSIYLYRQQNIRGNKVIEFEMKRLK